MRWVLNDERVSLLASGMGYYEEIEQNAAVLSSDMALTDEDRRLLADHSTKAYESPRIKAMGVDQQKRSSQEIAKTPIERNDKDGDGRLSRQESPSGQRRYFDACDRNDDGYRSLRELIAYDDIAKARDPDSGETVHLLGLLRDRIPGQPVAVQASGWVLVRDSKGEYSHVRIHDPRYVGVGVERHGAKKQSLRAVRAIAASPFPEDKGRVWYFGGFDAYGGPCFLGTGWIYRGEL